MSDTPLTPDSTPPAPPAPSAKPRTPDWWLMTKKFIKKGTSVASFSPSHGPLCRQMRANIDSATVQCSVERGAGTGPVTAEIMKRLKPHTKFLIVEIDPDFCTRLRDRFPGADVIEGDASKMEELLAARGLTQVDHVISGLPLPSFPKVLRDGIIRSSAKVLTPTGTFRQLTNMPWVYWPLYKKYFHEVKFNFVPLNIPPSGVYTCREYKA